MLGITDMAKLSKQLIGLMNYFLNEDKIINNQNEEKVDTETFLP